MRAAAIMIGFALSGCPSGDSPPRERVHYESAEFGFATSHPNTWSSESKSGHVLFAPQDRALAKHTILVRVASIPREIREGTATSLEEIVSATERALRGLPRSQALQRSRANAELRGARFALTFVPRGAAKPYQREHVVLVGRRQIFHVMYTAPAGELVDESAFNDIISTLKEG